jgi:integrase
MRRLCDCTPISKTNSPAFRWNAAALTDQLADVSGGICTSDGDEAFLFQPLVNYRTLEFARPLSTRMVHLIVRRWGDYCGVGKLSPHDLRRTAITRALDQGLSYRQVQMMSGHEDPKTVMRYDHNRENLEQNAVKSP